MRYILQITMLLCLCLTSIAQTPTQPEVQIGGMGMTEFMKLPEDRQKEILYAQIKRPKLSNSDNPLKNYKLIVHIPSGEYTTLIPNTILFKPLQIGNGELKIVRQSSFKLKTLIDRNTFIKKYQNKNVIFINKPIAKEKISELSEKLNETGKYIIINKPSKTINITPAIK